MARYAATPNRQKKNPQPKNAKNKRRYPAKCNPSSSDELCIFISPETCVLPIKEIVNIKKSILNIFIH
tara:strand:+ start:978 stop:1181 length:204 start_codon:yes stop_codon:yes gene_type:complete